MRNLLALLAAAVLVFAGVGWYLNWFKVQSVSEAFGHRSVNIDIDSHKISDDLHKGEAKVQQAIEKEQHKGDAGTHLQNAAGEVKDAANQVQQEVKDQVNGAVDNQADKIKADVNANFSRP